MKPKRQIKLLTKTTSIYLIFTFAAFFFSGLFLMYETEEYIEKELDGRFKWTEGKVLNDLNRHGKVRKRRSNVKVESVASLPEYYSQPVFTDTLIQNDERERKLLYRKRTSFAEINGNLYKIEIVQDISDFNRLQEDIFEGIIPAFLILAVVIVLFNLFLSGYFFKPFNKILFQMKSYKVGKGTSVSSVPTTTEEFTKMQQLFHNMIERTEKEFNTLKEYTENMGHEIQTPLTVIRNKTENLIDDENVMNSKSDSVKTIYDEINHLSKLGTALNLLTKVEHGEFNNKVEIYTKSLIEKHVDSISELINLKNLSIELNLSANHKITIDPILFDIILNNLFKNCLNYASDKGPITINSNETYFEITNFGDPLNFEKEKIFSRFSKENGSTNSLGLGLALVQKICETNNLKIDYNYENNQHKFVIR